MANNKRWRWVFENWSLLVVIFLGFTPLIWYREGLLIAGGDNYQLLNPGRFFSDYLSTWNQWSNLGIPGTQTPLLFPYTFFWFILEKAGLSLLTIERSWSVLLLLVKGVSFYSLFNYLLRRQGQSRSPSQHLAGLTATAFYMFNAFVMIDVVTPVARLVGGFFPLFLLLWIRVLDDRAFSLRGCFLLGGLSVFLASAYAQPVSTIAIPIACGLYLLFHLGISREFAHGLKVTALTLILFLLFNLWWLLPYTASMSGLLSSYQTAVKAHTFLDSTPIFEAFRLMGFWAFRGTDNFGAGPVAHIPYAHYYYEPLFILLGYGLTLLSLSTLFFSRRKKKVIYFLLLGFTGVFLSKGINRPLGQIYQFLYDYFPGFTVFREPFARFSNIHVLAFSILLGLGISFWAERLELYLKKFSGLRYFKFWPVAVFFAVLLLAFPIFSGKVVQDGSWYGSNFESLKVKVPGYWKEASAWIKGNIPAEKIIMWPPLGYGHCYRWPSGVCSAGPVASIFLSNPLYTMPAEEFYLGDHLIRSLYQYLIQSPNASLGNLFRFFDVHYLLNQRDIVWERTRTETPDSTDSAQVFSQLGLQKEATFGELDVYKTGPVSNKPVAYFPSDYEYIEGSPRLLLDKILLDNPYRSDRVYLFSEQEFPAPESVLKRSRLAFVDGVASPESSQSEQKFTINISRAGEYQLFLKENSAPLFLPGHLSYRLNGQSLSVAESPLTSKPWYALGRIYLSSGTHPLEVTYPSSGNFIPPEGFFFGSWNNKTKTWQLPEPASSNVSFIPLVNLTPGTRIQVSFLYRNNAGKVSHFGLQQNNCPVPFTRGSFDSSFLVQPGCKSGYSTPDLPFSDSWKPFTGSFLINQNTKTALLFFQFDPVGSSISLESLKVERAADLTLVAAPDFSAVEKLSPPLVSGIVKINPAKYFIRFENISSENSIIFNQSYNANWKAYPVSEAQSYRTIPWETFFLKPLPGSRHFLASGYANGWDLSPDDFKERSKTVGVIIEYQPQRYFVLGTLILLWPVVFGVLYCLWNLVEKLVHRRKVRI